MSPKYVPKKVAPLQYALRELNSEAGRVVAGWGTAPIMGVLLIALLLFGLTILQVYNGTILLNDYSLN